MLKTNRFKGLFRSLLILTCLVSLTSFQPVSDFYQLPRVKVIGVRDGDTIDIITIEKFTITIRLDGIDCPEKKQAFGEKAKQFTSDFSFGKYVRIKNNGKDGYGRVIGEVFNDKGVSLNKSLLKQGLAWHYKQYSKSTELAQLENEARKLKKGLWIDKNPISPWEFRKLPKIKK